MDGQIISPNPGKPDEAEAGAEQAANDAAEPASKEATTLQEEVNSELNSQSTPAPSTAEPAVPPEQSGKPLFAPDKPPVAQTKPKKKRNKKPLLFTLLAIILIAAAAVGTYYWQHKKVKDLTSQVNSLNSQVTSLQGQVSNLKKSTSQDSSTNSSTSTSASSDQYSGWKSFTLKLEKLSFKYPASWTLKDNSDGENDNVELNGTNHFEMLIGAGAAVSAVNTPGLNSQLEQADPVTFNGNHAYLDAIGSSSTISEIRLSSSSTDASKFFPTKNITTNASNSRVIVSIDYRGPNGSYPNHPQSLSYINGDVNYKDAKLVIESMHY